MDGDERVMGRSQVEKGMISRRPKLTDASRAGPRPTGAHPPATPDESMHFHTT